MADYDFSTLNDIDFEKLALDILEREVGQRIERFKRGKDQGVDGQYFTLDHGRTIIQCKHYHDSSVSTLISKLKREEVAKVAKLRPEKYIIATSSSLSLQNKEAIKEIFKPYITNTSDIIGRDDLNALLRKFREVEKAHYKLWITSSAVLDKVINTDIYGRSEHEAEEVKEIGRVFVVTESYQKASQKLHENRVIVITGEPGVGKTTLARQLWMDYVGIGYELVVMNNVSDGERVFNKENPQVFFFDDFAGANVLDALRNDSSSSIVGFLRRAKSTANKIVILTSRSTIINEFRSSIKHYDADRIISNEHEHRVLDMKPAEKALMLYNHIWHLGLQPPYIREICEHKFYRTIIHHRNFNPRLVSYITQTEWIGSVASENYCQWILEMLNNPSQIWEGVFQDQIDSSMRLMVMIVYINGGRIKESRLIAVFVGLNQVGIATCKHPHIDAENVLKKCVGSVLNRTILKDMSAEYSLFSPALGDYIIHNRTGNIDFLSTIVSTIHSVAAIRSIIGNAESCHNKSFVGDLISSVIRKGAYSNDDCYAIITASLALDNTKTVDAQSMHCTRSFVDKIILNATINGDLLSIAKIIENIAYDYLFTEKEDVILKYMQTIIDSMESYEDCLAVQHAMYPFEFHEDIIDAYRNACFNILKKDIDDIVDREGIIGYECLEASNYGQDDPFFTNAVKEAKEKTIEFIDQLNDDIGQCLSKDQMVVLLENVDFNASIEALAQTYQEEYEKSQHHANSSEDNLDEIFSRLEY